MLLSHYLSKKHHISDKEYRDMIRQRVISLNDTIVTDTQQTIAIEDMMRIRLPQGEYKEKVRSFPQLRPRLILFHKPKGYVVSKDDTHNKTIYELLPEHWRKNYVYIGRLDKNSH